MRDLDLTSLKLFVAVCDSGSLARAAEQGNLVASAVSKRLSSLEQTVGTALFIRVKHGVIPTPAGHTLLEHAREMLARSQRIERDMALFASGTHGQVRMLASASALAEHLAEDTAQFLAAPDNRNIRIDIEEGLSPDIVRGVREGSAAIGVCWDATAYSGLDSLPYSTDQLCIAVPLRHPLCQHDSLRLLDTLDYEHASMPTNSAVQVTLQRAAAQMGRTISHRVIVSNFESALRVVRAGLAISVVPREVGQTYAQPFGLQLIALNETWAKRQMIIIYKDFNLLSPAAKSFAQFLYSQAQARASTPP